MVGASLFLGQKMWVFWVDFFKSDEGKTGLTSLSPKNRFGGLGSFRVVEIGWTNFY